MTRARKTQTHPTITAVIPGYGTVEVTTAAYDAVIAKYLPASPARLREIAEERSGLDSLSYIIDVSAFLAILADFEYNVDGSPVSVDPPDEFECFRCGKPATHFLYVEGERAAGLFVCDEHADPAHGWTSGRVVEQLTTRIFACPDHAPTGIAPEPYDDGRPACSVCGKANYAVKPFRLKRSVVERGWYTGTGRKAVAR